MPDLQSLSRLVLKTDEWEQDGAALNKLLHQALPLLQQMFPFITALRIYRLIVSPGILKIVARTDKDTSPKTEKLPENALRRSIDMPFLKLEKSACVMRQNQKERGKHATILHYA